MVSFKLKIILHVAKKKNDSKYRDVASLTLPCFSALYCSSKALTESLRGPEQQNENKNILRYQD